MEDGREIFDDEDGDIPERKGMTTMAIAGTRNIVAFCICNFTTGITCNKLTFQERRMKEKVRRDRTQIFELLIPSQKASGVCLQPQP